MPRRLPPLHLLRVFERAAARLSFKLAAEDLFVTPSAVSHQVKSLEDQLGLALFQRGPRSIQLSEAGRFYAESLTRAFAEIEATTAELHARFKRGQLRINVTPFFAGELFIPRLHRFQERFGDIDLRVETAFSRMDEHPVNADLSILLGFGDFPGLVVHRLLSIRLVPAASPEYVRNLKLQSVADLQRATMVRYSSRLDAFELWAQAVDLDPAGIRKGVSFDTLYSALRAAEQSLGVAMAPLPLAQSWFDSGRLVPVVNHSVQAPAAFHLMYRPQDSARPAVESFKQWLIEDFARDFGPSAIEPQPK